MANGTITLSPVSPNPVASTAFTIKGSLKVTPSVTYKDDGGTAHAVTVSSPSQAFTLSHPGLAAGNHSIAFTDSVTGATATLAVTVNAAAATFISAGQSFTDAAGTLWELDTGENVLETPSGGTQIGIGQYGDIGWNAEAVGYYNGLIYVEDIRDNTWHVFDPINNVFSTAVTAPPGAPSGGPAPAVFIGAGQSFTDAAGNVWRLDTQENAFETPSGGSEEPLGPFNGIGWTAEAMAYYNGVVYIQDATDNSWHTIDPSTHVFSGAVTAPPGASPPTGGSGGTGAVNTFSTTFGGSFPSSQWVKSPVFDDGGDGYFSDNSAVTPNTDVMQSDNINLKLVAIGSNRYGAPSNKIAFAGIIDNYNGGHFFTQQYGYWEIDLKVDKVVGLGAFCFTLSPFNWPPNFGMPQIWTDSSGTMQLEMYASGDSSADYSLTEGSTWYSGGPTWTGTARHKYGVLWTADVIEFYIDRTQVLSVANPGGAYTNGDPMYSKIHVQTNFGSATPDVDTANLPAGANVYSFNVWDSRPF